MNGGGWIRTNDLRVMSPTSYQTALPRDEYNVIIAHLEMVIKSLIIKDLDFPVFSLQSALLFRPDTGKTAID